MAITVIASSSSSAIEIGIRGESGARTIQFPCEGYGGYSYTIKFRRPSDGNPYTAASGIIESGVTSISWSPTSKETNESGRGYVELIFTSEAIVAKTIVWTAVILPSIDDMSSNS